MNQLKRVAIVVGEVSGDILGAGLIRELKKKYPNCEFEGIGGERMKSQGMVSLFPMDRLAVMGLIDPLKRLPELLSIRRSLRERYLNDPPDVFIGIDAPDFNLALEKKLRNAKIKTVHYVSPSVWAWRQGRIKKIAQSVDLMLTLFPFEKAFYETHQVPVKFVGHPLADQIPIANSKAPARGALKLDLDKKYVAILPGSRAAEVEKIGAVFFNAANQMQQDISDLAFIVPAANEKRLQQIQTQLKNYPSLNVTVYLRRSHEVMIAADAILMASGTTSLEAMLIKRPMVIAYKVSALSYEVISRLVKVDFVGLPNLLANRKIVPELIQYDATPENILKELKNCFGSQAVHDELIKTFTEIHRSLRCNASEQAADAVESLCLQS